MSQDNKISEEMNISSLGTIMGIWAHPDDEIFSMGGLFSLATSNGQEAVCITATRGEQGVQDESKWPQAKLADIRTKEMEDAMKVLGLKHHYWLDYNDGDCKNVDIDQASKRIAKYIKQYNPDSIFTFGPDGITGHDDHRTMSVWTDRAVELAESKAKVYHAIITEESYKGLKEVDAEFDIFFNIDKPCTCKDNECSLAVRLSEETLDIKMKALECMPSQTEALLAKRRQAIRDWHRIESFVSVDCQ